MKVTPTSRRKRGESTVGCIQKRCLHNSTQSFKVVLEAGNPGLINRTSVRRGLQMSLVDFPHDKFRSEPGDELMENEESDLHGWCILTTFIIAMPERTAQK